MDARPAFIADAQAPNARKTCQSALDRLAVTVKRFAMFNASAGNAQLDAALQARRQRRWSYVLSACSLPGLCPGLPRQPLTGSIASRSSARGTLPCKKVSGRWRFVPAFPRSVGFAGFPTQNRIRETLSLRDKAVSDPEGTRRSVAQNVRATYFGLRSDHGQVKTLGAVELLSRSALDANRLGYHVGMHIS